MKNVTTIDIQAPITMLEEGTFVKLNSLDSQDVTLSKLKNITLPHTISDIPSNAFQDLDVTITLDKEVNSIKGAPWGSLGKVNWNTELYEYLDTNGHLWSVDLETGMVQSFDSNKKSVATIQMPDEINGAKVVGIMPGAFDRTTLNTVEKMIFSEHLKEIPEKLFYKADKLNKIILPTGLEKIGAHAFENCDQIITVEIMGVEGLRLENLKTIGDYAFKNSKIFKGKTLVLPSIESIGKSAFYKVPVLEVDLSESSLEILNDLVFYYSELASIKFPETLTTIGNGAFQFSDLKTIVIPESVTQIGESSFKQTGATSVTIKAALEEIPESAFSRLFDLETFIFEKPENVKKIGKSAFQSTPLGDIIENPLELFNQVTTIEAYTFHDTSIHINSFVIPSGVTHIEEAAFRGNYFIEVTIPSTVQSIGESVFSNCKNLQKATIEGFGKIEIDGIEYKSIMPNTFEGCLELTHVALSDELEYIASNAFSGTQLKELILPEGFKGMHKHALSNTNSLETIIFDRDKNFEPISTNDGDMHEPWSAPSTTNIYYRDDEGIGHFSYEVDENGPNIHLSAEIVNGHADDKILDIILLDSSQELELNSLSDTAWNATYTPETNGTYTFRVITTRNLDRPNRMPDTFTTQYTVIEDLTIATNIMANVKIEQYKENPANGDYDPVHPVHEIKYLEGTKAILDPNTLNELTGYTVNATHEHNLYELDVVMHPTEGQNTFKVYYDKTPENLTYQDALEGEATLSLSDTHQVKIDLNADDASWSHDGDTYTQQEVIINVLEETFITSPTRNENEYSFLGWQVSRDAAEPTEVQLTAQWQAVENEPEVNPQKQLITTRYYLENPLESTYTELKEKLTSTDYTVGTVVTADLGTPPNPDEYEVSTTHPNRLHELTVTSEGNAELRVYYDKCANTLTYTGLDSTESDAQNQEVVIIDQTHKVLLDVNEGTWIDSTNTYTDEVILDILVDTTLTNPTRTGYHFLGWQRIDATEGVDTHLVAQWKWVENEPEVNPQKQLITTRYYLENPLESTYTELKEKATSADYTIGTVVVADLGTPPNPDEYEVSTTHPNRLHELTVVSEGNTELRVYYDKRANKLTYTGLDSTESDAQNQEVVIIDQTHKVLLDVNEGTWVDSTNTYTDEVVLDILVDTTLTNPTRTGYHFLGWQRIDATEGVDTHLVAQWREESVEETETEIQIITSYFYEDLLKQIYVELPSITNWYPTTGATATITHPDMPERYMLNETLSKIELTEQEIAQGENRLSVYYDKTPENLTYTDVADGEKVITLSDNHQVKIDLATDYAVWHYHDTDYTQKEIIISVLEETKILSPKRDGYHFLGWIASADATEPTEVQLTAQWKAEENEPGVDSQTQIITTKYYIENPLEGTYTELTERSTASEYSVGDFVEAALGTPPNPDEYEISDSHPNRLHELSVTLGGNTELRVYYDKRANDLTYTGIDPTGLEIGDQEVVVIDDKHRVVLDINEGVWAHQTNTYTDEVTLDILNDTTLNNPTKEGYKFIGWKKVATPSNADVKLVAQWGTYTGELSSVVTKHFIEHPLTGEYIEDTTLQTTNHLEVGIEATATIHALEEYVFNPNHTENNLTVLVSEEGDLELRVYYDKQSNTVAYQGINEWQSLEVDQSHQITVNPMGGNWSSNDTIYTSETLLEVMKDVVIANPVREGYEFKGWKNNGAATGKDAQLVAQWRSNSEAIIKPQPNPNDIKPEDDPFGLGTTTYIQYVEGYPDGTFGLEKSASRGEFIELLTTILINGNSEIPDMPNIFEDVKEEYFASNAINFIASMGIIEGYEDGTFRARDSITRAEVASILVRTNGGSYDSTQNSHFSDVNENHWAYEAIHTAIQNGYFGGYGTSEFKPDEAITRAEIISVLNRLYRIACYEQDLSQLEILFSDVNKEHWAFEDVLIASHTHTIQLGGSEEVD